MVDGDGRPQKKQAKKTVVQVESKSHVTDSSKY